MTSTPLYFTKVVATTSGDAFLCGHAVEQGSEPTFTRFAKANDSGWVQLGDVGAVITDATTVPGDGERPSIAVLAAQGVLRLYRPGQQPVDFEIPTSGATLGLASGSDGIYVCGVDGQVLRLAEGEWEQMGQAASVDLFGLAEVSPGHLVVVGSHGFIAHRTPRGRWQPLSSGTEHDLLCIVASDDGGAWVGGDAGTLLRLTADFEVLPHSHGDHSIDALALLDGALYFTAVDTLFTYQPGTGATAVNGPFAPDAEFHCVSAAGDFLWVSGDQHVYRFGPAGWEQFLCPDNAILHDVDWDLSSSPEQFRVYVTMLLSVSQKWARQAGVRSSDSTWRPAEPFTIIDGDVDLDGNLIVGAQRGDDGILLVQGNVKCRNLAVSSGFSLACSGSLTVTEALITNHSDSTTAVAGKVSASVIVSGDGGGAWLTVYDEDAVELEKVFGYVKAGRKFLRPHQTFDLRDVLVDAAIETEEWDHLDPADREGEDPADYLRVKSTAIGLLAAGGSILVANQ